MTVTCPQCKTQYRYDVARFGQAERKRLKCPKCGNVFEVTNPNLEEMDSTTIGEAVAAGPPIDSKRPTTDVIHLDPEAPELPSLPPLPRDLRLSLAVIAGSQAGSVFPVGAPRLFLGRGSNMDVQLKDAEVSRRHAMFEVRGEEATIVDLGSTNGTYVSGERVERATVANQKEFTLGSTTLMFIVTKVGE